MACKGERFSMADAIAGLLQQALPVSVLHLQLQAPSLLGTKLVCTVTDSRTLTVSEFSC